jgi:hypothetical protein
MSLPAKVRAARAAGNIGALKAMGAAGGKAAKKKRDLIRQAEEWELDQLLPKWDSAKAVMQHLSSAGSKHVYDPQELLSYIRKLKS